MKLNALLAELIGTFALLFAGVGSIAMMTMGSPPPTGSTLLSIALAHGLAIAVCGSALGHVSGGHFNPAVSFGMAIGKKISFATMIGYWIAQAVGAVLATLLVQMATSSDAVKGGLPALGATVTPTTGLILEAVGTFFLVLVAFGTTADKRGPKVGAWFVGLTITTMILTFGPLTGCSINPARWLGPAAVGSAFGEALVYVVGPLLGGALAAALYCFVLAPESETPAEA